MSQPEYSDTDRVLYDMMVTDTGRIGTDSGDYLGRAWSAAKDMYPDIGAALRSPVGRIEAWRKTSPELAIDWYPMVSTFHFLRKNLLYNGELDLMVDAFIEWYDKVHPEASWSFLDLQKLLFDEDLMDEFSSALEEGEARITKRVDAACKIHKEEDIHDAILRFSDQVGGLRAFGDPGHLVVNTYNHDTVLDRDVQYAHYTDPDGTNMYFSSMHGGCDSRWGYTRPRFFECAGETTNAVFGQDNSCSVYSEDEGGPGWRTGDGGHSWESDSGVAPLNTYLYTIDPAEKGRGSIYVDEADQLYCPVTGGRLLVGL